MPIWKINQTYGACHHIQPLLPHPQPTEVCSKDIPIANNFPLLNYPSPELPSQKLSIQKRIMNRRQKERKSTVNTANRKRNYQLRNDLGGVSPCNTTEENLCSEIRRKSRLLTPIEWSSLGR